MPAWVEQGYNEYARRLPRELKLEMIEIPLAHRGKNADIERLLAKEGEAMMAEIKKTDYVISLDVDGRSWTTKQLAEQLQKWQGLGSDISLLVGGPDGLAPLCKKKSTTTLVTINIDLSPSTGTGNSCRSTVSSLVNKQRTPIP